MKTIKTKIFNTTLAVAFLGAMSASAAVIYDTTYDGADPYSQNDSGTGTGAVYTFSDDGNTKGVGGTSALSLEFDASGVVNPDQYALNMFSNQLATGTSADSTDLSDYYLEFDVSALGIVSNPQSILIDIKFQGGSVSKTTTFNVTGTGFDDISINLGAIGHTATVANINDSMQLKFYTYSSGGVDKFGRDAGNAIYVDNVTLTQVPEPSSVVLLMVAGGALVFFRRKK